MRLTEVDTLPPASVVEMSEPHATWEVSDGQARERVPAGTLELGAG